MGAETQWARCSARSHSYRSLTAQCWQKGLPSPAMKGAREYKSSQETASSIAGNPYLAFGDGKSVIGYPIEKYERERWETSPPSPCRWRMTSPCCCDAYEGLHNNSKTSIGHRRMGLEWIMLIRKRISNLTQSLASGSRWSYRCTIASEGKNKVVENVRLFNGPLLRVRLSTEWLVMFGSVSRG